MDAVALGENENFGEGEERSSRLSTRSKENSFLKKNFNKLYFKSHIFSEQKPLKLYMQNWFYYHNVF